MSQEQQVSNKNRSESTESNSRRKALSRIVASSSLIASSTTIPSTWVKPLVETVLLPVHAQTSETESGSISSPPTGPDFGCGPGNAMFDELFSRSFLIEDGTGDSKIFPPGATILDVTGIDFITDICTQGLGGNPGEGIPHTDFFTYRDCISFLSPLMDDQRIPPNPLTINNRRYIIQKLAGSCDFALRPVGGG